MVLLRGMTLPLFPAFCSPAYRKAPGKTAELMLVRMSEYNLGNWLASQEFLLTVFCFFKKASVTDIYKIAVKPIFKNMPLKRLS